MAQANSETVAGSIVGLTAGLAITGLFIYGIFWVAGVGLLLQNNKLKNK